MKNKFDIQKTTFTALFMALVCISTLFFKVQIPLGYAHLGNAFILLGCAFTGNPFAILIGGVGSALADLLGGYGEWILPTLIIKGLMGFAMAAIAYPHKTFTIQTFIGALVSILIMIFGYFFAGSILYGSFLVSAAAVPGYIGEGIVGIILFYLCSYALEKVNIGNLLKRMEK